MNHRARKILIFITVVTMFVVTVMPALATYTIGYWKNKGLPGWDMDDDLLVATGSPNCDGTGFKASDIFPGTTTITYLDILEGANAKDATYMLAAQKIAAELNVAGGACDAYGGNMQALVALADNFLAIHPVGSDPQGADRDYALAIKDCLDLHNNIEEPFVYDGSDAKACADALL